MIFNCPNIVLIDQTTGALMLRFSPLAGEVLGAPIKGIH
jgi:hypothetical protein